MPELFSEPSEVSPDVSRPASWQANLWGHQLRCHEEDRHFYLDDRFLHLTPIEYGLFWLLLRQMLHSLRNRPDLESPATQRGRLQQYLAGLGAVPTTLLLMAVTLDVSNLEPVRTDAEIALVDATEPSVAASPLARAALSTHLDRLRSKLRCHGLDVGTLLLCGRAAQGYILCPLGG